MQSLIQNRISQTNHLGQQFCMLYKYQVVGWIGFTHLNWQTRSIELVAEDKYVIEQHASERLNERDIME